jgi:hypothetical protein
VEVVVLATLPTLGTVKGIFVLLLLAAAVAIAIKFRMDAKRERHEVLARLSDETSTVSTVSPTEALFREEGVPVSDELRQGLVGAPEPEPRPNPIQAAVGVLSRARPAPPGSVVGSPPTGATAASVPGVDDPPPTTDLSDLCAGIEMPCGLAPLAMTGAPGINCAIATFSTSDDVRGQLVAELGNELVRVGCSVRWVDEATALVRRDADIAVVTIYDRPDELIGADGTSRFGAVPPGRVVVQLTAA